MPHIEDYSVVFSKDHRVTFKHPIAESIPFDNVIVLRLESLGHKPLNENVCALDLKGKMLWQIKPRNYLYSECPYVNLTRRGDFVEAYGWDGRVVTIDPRSGTLLGENWVDVGTSPRMQNHQKNYF